MQQLEARSNTLEAQKSALEAQVAELRQQLAAALAGSKDKSKACSDVVGGRDGTDHNAAAASAAIASAGAGTSAGPSAAAPPDAAAGHGADVGTGCRSGVQQRCVVSAAVQTELQLLPPQAVLHLQPDVPPAHTQPPLPPTIQQAEAQQAPWPSHQLALHSAASGESHQAGRTKPAPAPAAGSGSGAGPVRLGHGQQLQQHAMNAPAGTTAATTGPVGGAGAPPRLPPSQKVSDGA